MRLSATLRPAVGTGRLLTGCPLSGPGKTCSVSRATTLTLARCLWGSLTMIMFCPGSGVVLGEAPWSASCRP